jgi:hypothetical protein
MRIVSLMWGDPARYVEQVHDANGILLHTVGIAHHNTPIDRATGAKNWRTLAARLPLMPLRTPVAFLAVSMHMAALTAMTTNARVLWPTLPGIWTGLVAARSWRDDELPGWRESLGRQAR